MIKTISRTADTILVVDDSGIRTARADHPKWKELCDLFPKISYENDNFVGPVPELLGLMDLKSVIENYTVGLLSVNTLGVTYNNRALHTIDAARLMAFLRDGLPYKPIANYIARKMKNPSHRAINEMYNFLEHKGMPLTLSGKFIAYKGVRTDFWSISGNVKTVVLQGNVDSQGRILNTIGATIEVERSSVDDDFRNHCSAGLHVGSLAYAKGWGQRVLLVEVDPADVVSVPDDCQCQKLRCCKYTIVGEYSGPMPDTFTKEFDGDANICHQCGDTNGQCGCVEEDECDGCGQPADQCLCPPSEVELPVEPSAAPTPEPKPLITLIAAEHSGIYAKVVAILGEQLGIAEKLISPTSKPIDLGMDSLAAVELVMAFEEEFSFEILDELAEKHAETNVAQIVKDIANELTSLGHPLPPPVMPSTSHYDIGFADGKMQKAIDYGNSLYRPKYHDGDEKGADSEQHADYIRGYLVGYKSS